MPRLLKSFRTDSNIIINLTIYPYFDSAYVFIMNFNLLTLLMTFGALFPPLCIALMINIWIFNRFTKWKIKRFLHYAIYNHKKEYIQILESECKGFYKRKLLKRSIWLVAMITSCFYSVFLFDILGDAVGFANSYWVLIYMCLIPLFYLASYKTIMFVYKAWNNKIDDDDDDDKNNNNNTQDSSIVAHTENPMNSVQTDNNII